jgi:hypothetical protein
MQTRFAQRHEKESVIAAMDEVEIVALGRREPLRLRAAVIGCVGLVGR